MLPRLYADHYNTIDNTLYRMVKCAIKNAKGVAYAAYICK